jgi:hypothetical protein
MGEMVDHIMPAVKHIKHLLLNNHWESYIRIASIKDPIMFFVSENDELVPPKHAEKLFELATNAKFKNKVNGCNISMLYLRELIMKVGAWIWRHMSLNLRHLWKNAILINLMTNKIFNDLISK